MIKKTKQPSNQLDITEFTFFRDLLLVKAIRPVSKNGKLVDPKQYEDKPEFGEVIKLGDALEGKGILKVGDIVRFGKYSTEAIRSNGEDYFIVNLEDVSAKL